jgi:hypothetical protein
LQWLGLPPGWEVKPQPVDVSALATYQVRRASLDARFNLDKITPGTREPIELQFVDGFTKIANPLKIVLPVAVSERREGRLDFDGRLDDWTADDLIQDGPMVQMLNRPGLQKQALELASTRSRIYTGWAAENFYVAFALDGISRSSAGGRNFVDYQARRAWGEDLCEVLIQAVYANNQLGPVLHVVCKPNGGNWVERKLNPRQSASPWEPFEAGVRYHAVTSGTNWTGEVAIPWKIFTNANLGSPLLLRFNFAQHRTATGESASWAGPIDFGRDDAFMGALQIHAINAPGMAQRPER